jgi:hypothetical protein
MIKSSPPRARKQPIKKHLHTFPSHIPKQVQTTLQILEKACFPHQVMLGGSLAKTHICPINTIVTCLSDLIQSDEKLQPIQKISRSSISKSNNPLRQIRKAAQKYTDLPI